MNLKKQLAAIGLAACLTFSTFTLAMPVMATGETGDQNEVVNGSSTTPTCTWLPAPQVEWSDKDHLEYKMTPSDGATSFSVKILPADNPTDDNLIDWYTMPLYKKDIDNNKYVDFYLKEHLQNANAGNYILNIYNLSGKFDKRTVENAQYATLRFYYDGDYDKLQKEATTSDLKWISAPTDCSINDSLKIRFKTSSDATFVSIKIIQTDNTDATHRDPSFGGALRYFAKDGQGYYIIDLKDTFLEREAIWNEDFTGDYTVRIYVGTGNFYEGIDGDKFPRITSSTEYASIDNVHYDGSLKNLQDLAWDNEKNPVTVSVDAYHFDISFPEFKDPDGISSWDYILNIKYGDNTIKDVQCRPDDEDFIFNRSKIPSFTKRDGIVTISINDAIRAMWEQDPSLADDSTISVTLKGDTNRNKYKRSTESQSVTATYKRVTELARPEVQLTDTGLTTDTSQEITIPVDQTKNILRDSESADKDAPLKLVVSPVSHDGAGETNIQTIGKKNGFTGITPFQLNLSTDSGTAITETKTSLKITIPVPESIKAPGREYTVLRDHDGKVDWIGSGTGDSVTIWTNKFSDYAIAYQGNDQSGDNQEGTDTTPKDDGSSSSGGSASSGGSSSSGSGTTPSFDKSAVTKTVTDSITEATTTVASAEIPASARTAASQALEAAKAKAEKAIKTAATKADADQAVRLAEEEVKAIEARIEQAGKVTDLDNSICKEAAQFGIVSGYVAGTSRTTFTPNATLTRAQFLTWLYQYMGSPEVESSEVFTDVAPTKYYANAVAWAAANGITAGIGNGKFAPNAAINRAQAMTFLYKALGSQKVERSAKFTDAQNGAYYTDAVNWAVANNITAGTGGNKFSPNADCTRGQGVIFMFKAATI